MPKYFAVVLATFLLTLSVALTSTASASTVSSKFKSYYGGDAEKTKPQKITRFKPTTPYVYSTGFGQDLLRGHNFETKTFVYTQPKIVGKNRFVRVAIPKVRPNVWARKAMAERRRYKNAEAQKTLKSLPVYKAKQILKPITYFAPQVVKTSKIVSVPETAVILTRVTYSSQVIGVKSAYKAQTGLRRFKLPNVAYRKTYTQVPYRLENRRVVKAPLSKRPYQMWYRYQPTVYEAVNTQPVVIPVK